MSFLAPFLFALAGFAGIPILLHLIRRKRVRILDFPTFRFLQRAALQQRVHLRLQDQLLMLIRILVILLLVLAFVGPLTSRAVEPKRPVLGIRNLLILDDSLSMSARAASGETLFAKAVDLARRLTTRAQGEWRLVSAGQVESGTEDGALVELAPEDFFGAASTRSEPRARLSVYDTARKASALADSDTEIWVLTDAADSNFQGRIPQAAASERRLNLLVVGEPADRSNWAIGELVLNNQPLLENEPALLTVFFESFGPILPGQGPAEIEFSWRLEGDTTPKTAAYSIASASGAGGRLETALDVAGRILSASCRLVFRDSYKDALAGDNSAIIYPRTLGDLSLTLLAPSEYWRRMLAAALPDFRVVTGDPSQPPPPNLEPPSALVLVLGEAPLHDEWRRRIQAEIEGGTGVLILYDERPSGSRLENWSKTWSALAGVRIQIETLEAGARQARGGANPWFAQSLQDILQERLEWASGELALVQIPEWEGEWFLSGGQDGFLPIFQTAPPGSGAIASFGVPLSLGMTPLALEPHWVPLLSQLVKRTLFDPGSLDSTSALVLAQSRESDLQPATAETRRLLSEAGVRVLDAERILADVEKLPSRSHDWTLICLALCLGLAILEIAVSNLI